MESSGDPMDGQELGTCGAQTRHGTLCKNRPMANGRCRFHGGMSLSGKQHGQYKHGFYTKEAVAQRRRMAALIKECREALRQIG